MNSYFKSPPFFITLIIMAFVTFMYFNFKDKYVTNYDNPLEVVIKKKWELPNILEEVSGIAHIDDQRVACVQDEEGKIFIYNLETKSIEKTVNFGEQGDYEGISIVGTNAFVVKSNGTLYEVKNFIKPDFKVITHNNFLTKDFDVEGLCYDKKNNRLLLACKENEDHRGNFKSVYAFNLPTKELLKTPVFKLMYDNPVFQDFDDDRDEKLFRTSEIKVHPTTNDIYMLDGVIPKILILNDKWEAQKLLVLDPDTFQQPEGLSFDSNGEMFISNEGDLQSANILQVSLNEKNTGGTKKKVKN